MNRSKLRRLGFICGALAAASTACHEFELTYVGAGGAPGAAGAAGGMDGTSATGGSGETGGVGGDGVDQMGGTSGSAPDMPKAGTGGFGNAGASSGAPSAGNGGTAGDSANGGNGGNAGTLNAGNGGVSGVGGRGLCTPNTFPGVVLWLDAGSGVVLGSGDDVAEWNDSSGRKNHAQQPREDFRPALEDDVIAGRSTIRFNPAATTFLKIRDHETLQWGTGDFALFAVARFEGTNRDQTIYQKTEGQNPWKGPSLLGNPQLDKTASSNFSVQIAMGQYLVSTAAGITSKPHLFGAVRSQSTLELRVDGKAIAEKEVDSVDVSAIGRDVMIGQQGYNEAPGLQAVDGDIAEIVAIKGAINSSDLRCFERLMLDKYALDAAP